MNSKTHIVPFKRQLLYLLFILLVLYNLFYIVFYNFKTNTVKTIAEERQLNGRGLFALNKTVIRNSSELVLFQAENFNSLASVKDEYGVELGAECTKMDILLFYNATVTRCGAISDSHSLLMPQEFRIWNKHKDLDYCQQKQFNIYDKLYNDPPQFSSEMSKQVGVIYTKQLIPVIFRWGSGFPHFIKDILPRLVFLLPLLDKFPESKLLLDDGPPIEPMIRHLGIPKSRILFTKEHAPFENSLYGERPKWVYHADRIFVAHCSPGPMVTGKYPATIYLRVREKILEPLGKPSVLQGSIMNNKKRLAIYVSRGGSNNKARYISNEKELLHAVKQKLGEHWDLFVFDSRKTTFRESVQLFNKADIVFGPHGGGMYNVISCSSGTIIFELQPGGYGRKEVAHLAAKLGLNHFGIFKIHMAKTDQFGEIPYSWVAAALESIVSHVFVDNTPRVLSRVERQLAMDAVKEPSNKQWAWNKDLKYT